MRKIALIDYENIGSLEKLELSSYDEVIVFAGASQNFVRLPSSRGTQDIRIRQATAISKNNVDFHLVLELGRLSVLSAQAEFHIMSYDQGFDGIISFLNHSGYQCQRCEPETPPDKKEKSTILTKEILNHCRKCVKNQPKSVESLNNFIRASSGNRYSKEQANLIINELTTSRMITVTGNKVVWRK